MRTGRRSLAPRRIALVLPLALSACTYGLAPLRQPPREYAVATGAPWSSMVYAARTERGVIVVDLGWYGAGSGLRRALREVGATPDEVSDVFLTHSHRDHIGAWPLLRRARFHVSSDETDYFASRRRHHDLPSSGGDLLFGGAEPWPGEVDVRPFAADTAFAFGADTVRAYLLPGHTAGSAAYLFRGTLFVGDAFAWNRVTGLRPPFPIFTADRRRSAASLRRVLEAARPRGVERLCNAHAKCLRADSAFIARLERWSR
jgi:glyoxylase-like metal-dependent hydrolase (beta-lactamase superfamily II)